MGFGMNDYDRGVADYMRHLPAKENQSDDYYRGYAYCYEMGEVSAARCAG